MQVIDHPSALQIANRNVSLAIGVFDGVHLGHQQVIRHAVADAEQHEGIAVAVTFDRHPNAIVAPQRVPPLIYAQAQKLRALASLGLDATYIVRFDEAFSRKPGATFIRELGRDFRPLHSIAVGNAFSFGYKRDGDVELLKRVGAELKVIVHGIAAVALDGETVSSTRIREVIKQGDLDKAGEMLGREYALRGKVTRGDQIGRTLGFPTANLETTGLILPPAGVYAVHAYVGGRRHRAVANIGQRPTLDTPTPVPRVETHLIGFEGDLYGAEMELMFAQKLRDERRFPSVEALRAQIQRDIEHALRVF